MHTMHSMRRCIVASSLIRLFVFALERFRSTCCERSDERSTMECPPTRSFSVHAVWSSGCRLFARKTAAAESLAVTRAMRALRLLVLALALALAPLHAHADRGNYLRCVAFVPPRGFRVPRQPSPSVALAARCALRRGVSGRDARGRSARTRAHRRVNVDRVALTTRRARPKRAHQPSFPRAPSRLTREAPNRFSRTFSLSRTTLVDGCGTTTTAR